MLNIVLIHVNYLYKIAQTHTKDSKLNIFAQKTFLLVFFIDQNIFVKIKRTL